MWASRCTDFGPINGPVHAMNALDKCDKGRGIFDSHHGKSLKASSVGFASSGTLTINVDWHNYYSYYREAIS